MTSDYLWYVNRKLAEYPTALHGAIIAYLIGGKYGVSIAAAIYWNENRGVFVRLEDFDRLEVNQGEIGLGLAKKKIAYSSLNNAMLGENPLWEVS